MNFVIILLTCFLLMFNTNVNVCEAFDAADLYREVIWISLDNLSTTQQAQIDKIIQSKNTEVQKIMKNVLVNKVVLKSTNNKNVELISFLNVMGKIEQICDETQDEIMQCLSVEQRIKLENLLEKRQTKLANTVEMLIALNMDNSQQTKIINTLLLSKQQIWTHVANSSLSWQDRIKRARIINTFRLISSYLTYDQDNVFQSFLMTL